MVFLVLRGWNSTKTNSLQPVVKNPPLITNVWKDVNVDRLTPPEMVDYLQWPNSSSCRLFNQFGGVAMSYSIDGQKSVCLDTEVRPYPGNCLVYSFGINNEWSFEDQMEEYGCDVFAFDPSMNKTYFRRGYKIHFFENALGDRVVTNQKGWKVKRLSDLYQMVKLFHGPNRIIDYLKIDIESDEWKALPEILRSGMMANVRQLGVEVHLPRNGTLADVRSVIRIIRSLEDYGMVRFDSKINALTETWMDGLNMTTYWAYEIAWYNNRLRRDPAYYLYN